jgi:hypothetical protein
MRKNPPKLIQPDAVVSRATDRSLGLRSQLQLQRELDQLGRRVNVPVSAADSADPFANGVPAHLHPFSGILTGSTKWDHTAQTITSTTGTTVGNFNLGPLLAGVSYQVKMHCEMAANAPSGFLIYAVARIEASGTNVDGMDTATVGGERTLTAFDAKIVVGTGASINIAARSRVTGGTGSINSGLAWAEAIPLITQTN